MSVVLLQNLSSASKILFDSTADSYNGFPWGSPFFFALRERSDCPNDIEVHDKELNMWMRVARECLLAVGCLLTLVGCDVGGAGEKDNAVQQSVGREPSAATMLYDSRSDRGSLLVDAKPDTDRMVRLMQDLEREFAAVRAMRVRTEAERREMMLHEDAVMGLKERVLTVRPDYRTPAEVRPAWDAPEPTEMRTTPARVYTSATSSNRSRGDARILDARSVFDDTENNAGGDVVRREGFSSRDARGAGDVRERGVVRGDVTSEPRYTAAKDGEVATPGSVFEDGATETYERSSLMGDDEGVSSSDGDGIAEPPSVFGRPEPAQPRKKISRRPMRADVKKAPSQPVVEYEVVPGGKAGRILSVEKQNVLLLDIGSKDGVQSGDYFQVSGIPPRQGVWLVEKTGARYALLRPLPGSDASKQSVIARSTVIPIRVKP